jgi:trimethylamine--corrinoid protein Co-methyltransferase
MSEGFTRRFPSLDVLAEDELAGIHRGATYILAKTGMQIEHKGALELLAEKGCHVDFDANRARFPSWLVEACLRETPSCYTIRARDPKKDIQIGGNTVHFMQGMGMRFLDLETQETRAATADEHRQAMLIADALPNIHIVDGVFLYMERQGIPALMVMLENLASGLRFSSKPQHFGYQKDCEIFAIQMAQSLGINLSCELDAAYPLTIYPGAVEAAFRYLPAKFAIMPCTGIALGSEGPATLAGSVSLAMAGTMAWIVLCQLIQPGAPLLIEHGIKAMNMRSGNPRHSGPEHGLTSAMMGQLLRHYGIPSCSTAGFTSNSKVIDFQVGFEKSLGTLASTLFGGNVMIYQGGSSNELSYSPELSILDDDVAGWIGRFIEGVSVTDETMAIDLINQVGPIPGHYLSTAHTREWWRKEQYLPQVADLSAYPVWLKSVKKDALQLAKEKMQEILDTHQPSPLTSAQEQALADILAEARQYYRDKGLIPDDEWADYMHLLHSAD